MRALRNTSVAGQFYPGSRSECIREIEKYASIAGIEAATEGAPRAGIVPHAGWVFSGATAGKVFAYIKKSWLPSTFIIFGAAHRFLGSKPVIMKEGAWETPLGEIEIDAEAAEAIVKAAGEKISADAGAHDTEHSIEVQIPFIQHLFPGAKIVPVLVPATDAAAAFGMTIGKTFAGMDHVAVIGSTDLTHYGWEYGFAPKDTGPEALKWVREVNDKQIVDMMLAMKMDGIVKEASRGHSACGAGAAAAAIAAAAQFGKTRGALLEYTTSHDVMPRGKPSMFVGYAGIVY